MNRYVLAREVQNFIMEHQDDDPLHIALQKSPFPDVTPAELAAQIDGRKRCSRKLPAWFNTPGIYYPPKLNVEQASSELTAWYKSRLIKGNSVADLTGGFGVDTFFFAKRAKEVTHIEQNEELSEIAHHNAGVLGINNITFLPENSISFLKNADCAFGTIYADPARRKQDKKVFLLKDTEPDVVKYLPLMLSKADRIIIKTSPLFDIQSGLKELKHVSGVHVASVKNDCKELLWVIDKGFEGEPEIYCAALNETSPQYFSFSYPEERESVVNNYSEPLAYLYEPDAALMKAGCFKLVANRYQLSKLHPNTHLYTSNELNQEFLGRTFRICDLVEYKTFKKKKEAEKANVLTRNFPLTTAELKKKHRLTDGGDKYLIFTTGISGTLLVAEAERVKS